MLIRFPDNPDGITNLTDTELPFGFDLTGSWSEILRWAT